MQKIIGSSLSTVLALGILVGTPSVLAQSSRPGLEPVLALGSADNNVRVELGSRMQMQSSVYDADKNSFGNGTAVSRLFLELRGTVYEWSYRYQYDFARPSGTDESSRGIRDAWIQYNGFEKYRITIGNFKEPFGLERLGNWLSTTFIERAVTDIFSPDRHLGIGMSTGGSRWSFSAGAFGETPEGDVEKEGNEARDLTSRVTVLAVDIPDTLVHLGIAGRYHEPNDSNNYLRFRSKPESAITSVRVIDTNVIGNVDDFGSIGLEFLTIRGPFSFQSEYVQTMVHRSAAAEDIELNSWYAFVTWTVTGESRQYRRNSAVVDRPIPNRPLGNGGFGAWEIAARFSSTDLTDNSVIGGELDNLTLGINWYANPTTRFSTNYTRVISLHRPDSIYHNQGLQALTVMAQLDF